MKINNYALEILLAFILLLSQEGKTVTVTE